MDAVNTKQRRPGRRSIAIHQALLFTSYSLWTMYPKGKQARGKWRRDLWTGDSQMLMQFCNRACYKLWPGKNPEGNLLAFSFGINYMRNPRLASTGSQARQHKGKVPWQLQNLSYDIMVPLSPSRISIKFSWTTTWVTFLKSLACLSVGGPSSLLDHNLTNLHTVPAHLLEPELSQNLLEPMKWVSSTISDSIRRLWLACSMHAKYEAGVINILLRFQQNFCHESI